MRQIKVITKEKTEVIYSDFDITPISGARILASYIEKIGMLPTMRRNNGMAIFDFTQPKKGALQ